MLSKRLMCLSLVVSTIFISHRACGMAVGTVAVEIGIYAAKSVLSSIIGWCVNKGLTKATAGENVVAANSKSLLEAIGAKKACQLLASQSKELCTKVVALSPVVKESCRVAFGKTVQKHPYMAAIAVTLPVLQAIRRRHGDRVVRMVSPGLSLKRSKEKGTERADSYYCVVEAKLAV